MVDISIPDIHVDTIRAALLTCKHYLPDAEPVRNHDVDAALAAIEQAQAAQPAAQRPSAQDGEVTP